MITNYTHHQLEVRLSDADTFSAATMNELPSILQCDVVYYIPSRLNFGRKEVNH